jgi:hypothetical protein
MKELLERGLSDWYGHYMPICKFKEFIKKRRYIVHEILFISHLRLKTKNSIFLTGAAVQFLRFYPFTLLNVVGFGLKCWTASRISVMAVSIYHHENLQSWLKVKKLMKKIIRKDMKKLMTKNGGKI